MERAGGGLVGVRRSGVDRGESLGQRVVVANLVSDVTGYGTVGQHHGAGLLLSWQLNRLTVLIEHDRMVQVLGVELDRRGDLRGPGLPECRGGEAQAQANSQ